jgi:ribosome-associated protein YbcJ (S4-like RNA binding protein)
MNSIQDCSCINGVSTNQDPEMRKTIKVRKETTLMLQQIIVIQPITLIWILNFKLN